MKTILFLIITVLIATSGVQSARGQDRVEPTVISEVEPLTPLGFGIRNGIGLRVQLNNFGFGVGGEYRRVLAPFTTGIVEFQITNLKDDGEQTFQNLWGYTVIPNKYNRIIAFPLTVGLNRRLFAHSLNDDFRLFVQASAGIAPAYVYPYYDHDFFTGWDAYGFRIQGLAGYADQPHYDMFQGWGEGYFTLGSTGLLSIGADLGGDFGNLQSIRIGYSFYHYASGIQVMEPNRPGIGFDLLPPDELPPGAIQPAADKQYFFFSPHFTLTFGTMW